MVKKGIAVLVSAIGVIIIGLFLTNKFGPNLVMLIPLGILGLSTVFFSRGTLIFLTIICLSATWVPFAGIGKIALQFRWVFFALFCLHVFGDIFLGRTVRRIKPFDILAILFIIYGFSSTFYSAYPALTLERSTTVLVLYISVFWIIWKYAYERGPENVVYLILRVMLLISAIGYLMIFIGPYRPFYAGRFTGIYGNPNGLGVISAIILPLSFWQFLETKKKSALFLFLMISAGLLLCGARGSINAAVVSMAYFIYARLKRYRALVLFSSLSFILITVWLIETVIKEAFKAYIRVETIPILGGRLEVWPIAVNLIMDKPVFGYGFGVEDKIFALKKIVFLRHAGLYVHNSYLGILLQLGLIGFILLFIPLFILLLKELFSRQEGGATPLLRYALRASLIAGLFCCIYESWVYSVGNAVAFPFWIIVMLLAFYRYNDRRAGVSAGVMGT